MQIQTKLTVFFDNPFWVGVFERTVGDSLEACRIVFGAEPKDHEVYARLLREANTLNYSPPVKAKECPPKRANPKRLQREAGHLTEDTGVGTKAQEALKAQYEMNKKAHKTESRAEKEEKERRLFEMRQAKKREKRKGH